MTATRNAGEQGGAGYDPGRHPLGRPTLQMRLDAVEGAFVNDGRHGQRDPFRRRPGTSLAAVGAIKMMQAVIGGGGQDDMDAAGREPPAPSEDAALIEVGGNRLHPQRTAFVSSGQSEDLTDDACCQHRDQAAWA